ncbi:MAG: carboxypeptidase regulatory-like domain-containing protein [Gemmatimonadetes bacterium]|nr:carboxypeptidase regulatory-like domain-containing protein [Gemmatimonadota bacterium]
MDPRTDDRMGPRRPRTPRDRGLPASLVLGVALSAISGLFTSAAAAQTIDGTLMDLHSGQPIPLGLVMMFTESGDSVAMTVTDERGHFRLSSPDPGSFVLLASALGYKETADGVFELGEDGVMTVEHRLAPQPLPIDALIVSLRRPVLQHHLVRNGFVRRLQRGLGEFITPHDIEESAAISTEDLFAGLPGLRVGAVYSVPRRAPPPGIPPESYPRPDIGETVQVRSSNGGWCVPTVYLDGSRVHYEPDLGSTLSNMADIGAVDAIEVYRRTAEIPVEYSSGTESNCGVLVVWTKSGLAAGQRPEGAPRSAVAGSRRLPSVEERGPPPTPGERIRMELVPHVGEELGLASPFEGTFLTVRGDDLLANDPSRGGRTLALPLSGLEAVHALRERHPRHAMKRGAIAGTAFGVGMWQFLAILCGSGCDSGSASTWFPATVVGAFVGFMVGAQGPGTHWVDVPVPEPAPAEVGLRPGGG